jgi:hypothetical protein
MVCVKAEHPAWQVAPILGGVTVNGQVARFRCKQTIPLSLWEGEANRTKGKGVKAQKINHALDKIKEV